MEHENAHPPPVPRWLSARAARWLAAIIEASIDAVGHERTVARLSTPEGIRTLSLLAGGPEGYERQLAFVASALRRGIDVERLGLAMTFKPHPQVCIARACVPLGGRGGEVISLPQARSATTHRPLKAVAPWPMRRTPTVDAERLTAALHLPNVLLPAPFDRLTREPGYGPRVLRALAFAAEWILCGPPEDEERLVFAMGAMQGRPLGVSLSIYDRALVILERVLHGSGPKTTRVFPILALAQTLMEHGGWRAPIDPDRVLARDARGATALLLVCAGQTVRPPPLPRRPRRQVHRDPNRYRPSVQLPRVLSALEGQGDFFAP